jgi:hypothetical protein
MYDKLCNAKAELSGIISNNNLSIIGGEIEYRTGEYDDEINDFIVYIYSFDKYNNQEAFLDDLNFAYDNDFGGQMLYGNIYCIDKITNEPVWLTRGEYDGSEWWDINRIPNIYKDKNFIKIL